MYYFVFELYGDHRDLHVLTQSVPTRRSSELAPRSTDGRPARSRATTLARGWWPCGSRSPAMLAATCRGSVRSIGGRSGLAGQERAAALAEDRKSTRLNSSH